MPATPPNLSPLRLILIGTAFTVLAACSAGSGAPSPASTPQPSAGPSTPGSEVDAEAVGVAAALTLIRGHHQASIELLRAGDTAGSLAHSTHPVAEVIDSIRGDLEAAGAPAEELATSLDDVITAAQTQSEEDLLAAINASAALVEQSEQAVAGSAIDDSAYVGSVIAQVLATAAHEYEEAVIAGAVVEPMEYQDAYAFVQQAAALYEQIAAEVEAADAEEAAEIDEAFETLRSALASVQPPQTAAPIEDVEAAAALIAHELEEVVGALPIGEVDPQAEREAIEGLLDRILALVESGDREQAAELAAEAYLEHYEVIEAGVIAAAPEVNAELEPLLGAGLRQQIREGATLEEIEASVTRAKELLGQALEALEQH